MTGSGYSAALDDKRLKAQRERVRDYMLACAMNRQWHTLSEICESLEAQYDANFPQASVSARLRDLRKVQYGAYTVDKRRRGAAHRGLFEYRIYAPVPVVAVQLELLRAS